MNKKGGRTGLKRDVMIAERNNIILRKAVDGDAVLLTSWWNDGSVMAHAGFPYGLGTDAAEVKEQIIKNNSSSSALCIIEFDGKSIGECSYRLDGDSAVIGIKICEFDYQDRGIGTETIGILMDYLFKKPQINKIVLDTNLNNKRARHVYEKLGFREVNINIDSWKDQLGNLQSSADYELTEEDYKKRQCRKHCLSFMSVWFRCPGISRFFWSETNR